jgi:hypothetical protein
MTALHFSIEYRQANIFISLLFAHPLVKQLAAVIRKTIRFIKALLML